MVKHHDRLSISSHRSLRTRQRSQGWDDGWSLGAAIAADYFAGEDQRDLPDEVFRGLEGEIKRVIAGEESFWWNVKKAGITPADVFMPLPKKDSKPDPAYWNGM